MTWNTCIVSHHFHREMFEHIHVCLTPKCGINNAAYEVERMKIDSWRKAEWKRHREKKIKQWCPQLSDSFNIMVDNPIYHFRWNLLHKNLYPHHMQEQEHQLCICLFLSRSLFTPDDLRVALVQVLSGHMCVQLI